MASNATQASISTDVAARILRGGLLAFAVAGLVTVMFNALDVVASFRGNTFSDMFTHNETFGVIFGLVIWPGLALTPLPSRRRMACAITRAASWAAAAGMLGQALSSTEPFVRSGGPLGGFLTGLSPETIMLGAAVFLGALPLDAWNRLLRPLSRSRRTNPEPESVKGA